MLETDQFAYGVIVPVLAFVVSCLGCGLGLAAAARGRAASSRLHRGAWLVVAAIAVGGVGVWSLHAAALLGFDVEGAEVRYDVPTAAASVGVAVLLVGAGLRVVSARGDRPAALALGGALAGLGVVGTHHVGVAAVRLEGEIHLHPAPVAASAVLAVAGAVLALRWNVLHRDWRTTTGAALALGLAVSGTHYTGMAAVSVSGAGGEVLTGTDPGVLVTPFLVLVVGTTIVLAFVVCLWPTEEEIRAQGVLAARRRYAALATSSASARPSSSRSSSRVTPSR
ncbi:MHYT domain-containing protein [Isoptericola variabilis]|uniref:Putative integral membrane sensor protein n=1 Tax=Isoptericola variabilis (strain 225) TaxID=743718 RepID=F6FTC4_ISOV2|nr:MHYT domain-containing protein [Isoptericola variabilis]AEG45288.1 putative integral membrane sensor protein [Isoptericola variabilis 225]TWH34788.1 NO-binding membrane sensor protein with MHYT domain [Isoptericola variabilis J7]